MAHVPIFTFNNGRKVPAFGLGCWMGQPGKVEDTEVMVKTALKHGYRHFDTATGYGNEEAVGKAIRESGIPREDIFLTTKFTMRNDISAKSALESSLAKLGLGYIDLWLMHWPIAFKDDPLGGGEALAPEESPNYVEVWKEMENLYEKDDKVKSIGVSNFSIKTLDILLKEARIMPVTNQVELHPAYPQNNLLEYCKKKNIIMTAYSPLGQTNSPFFNDPLLQDIAKEEGGTVAQVVLSWGVRRGTIVIPKSEKENRIKENIQILSLSDKSMKAVDDWHKGTGKHRTLDRMFQLNPGKVFGWTYEQFGWSLKWDDEKKTAFVV